MPVTLAALRPKLLHKVSGHDADTLYTPEVQDEFLNEAIQQVNSEVEWPWLQATTTIAMVVGQSAYSLNTLIPNWARIHSVFDPFDGSRLELRTIQELDRIIYSGVPRIYTVFGDQLIVKPIPQDTRNETVHYTFREPLLVGDNDALNMPNNQNWDKGVIEYAAYISLRFLREDVRAESAYTAYTRWVTRIRDEKIRWREPLRVRVREGNMI